MTSVIQARTAGIAQKALTPCIRLSRLVVVGIIAFGITNAIAQTTHAGHSGTIGSEQSGYQAEMHSQMAKMNSEMTSAPMTGNPDLDFATMMIPHHQGAIDMAKTQLKYGKDSKLRKMAQKIIEAQESEIDELKERISDIQKSGGSSGFSSSGSKSTTSEKKDEKHH